MSICMDMKYGGLFISNLQDMNISMVGSWRIYVGEKLWRNIVDANYEILIPIQFVVKTLVVLFYGNGSCGPPKRLD